MSIKISVGASALSKNWKLETLTWPEMVQRLSTATDTQFTREQFIKLDKSEQSKVKDVGGYVGGELQGKQRTRTSVKNRYLVCLDIDHADMDFWDMFTMIYDCSAILHSTHSHSEENPRFRLILPLSRPVVANQYEPVARKIAGELDIELFDSTTFQASRLMFWPAKPRGEKYYFEIQHGNFIDPDELLRSYKNWRDVKEWPRHKKDANKIAMMRDKQEHPHEKKHWIGAFCRLYSVEDAISKFIPDVYIPSGVEGRYTYTGGSTHNGVVVYDDGLFIYSNHHSDPCGMRLSNAYDMVKLHKFSDLDDGSKLADTDKAPSIKAMQEFMLADEACRKFYAREKAREAQLEFENSMSDSQKQAFKELGSDDMSWTDDMEVDTKGNYINNAHNFGVIFTYHPYFKDLFFTEEFTNQDLIRGIPPWDKRLRPVDRPFSTRDLALLRHFMGTTFKMKSSAVIEDAVYMAMFDNGRNMLQEYLLNCKWDGVPRINTFAAEYFGVEQNEYHAQVFRKFFVGAISRAFKPGCKFDLVPIFIGGQGFGKSTFVHKFAKGFSTDSLISMGDKDSMELLQDSWIVEIAELSAFRKSRNDKIKQFLTSSTDKYRAAYAKQTESHPRKCVFVGTTNDEDIFTDMTGNRRFLPINIREQNITKYIKEISDEEVDQIWAEAMTLYKAGEPRYMTTDVDQMASKHRQVNYQKDDRFELLDEWLDRRLPLDWYKMDFDQMSSYMDMYDVDTVDEITTLQRVNITTLEIGVLFLGFTVENFDKAAQYKTGNLFKTYNATFGKWSKTTDRRIRLKGIQKKAYSRLKIEDDGQDLL